MALSVINYFFFDISEARYPLMLIDGLTVWGLTVFEKQLRVGKNVVFGKHNGHTLQNETLKQSSRALKLTTIQQKKTEQKKQCVDKKASHTAPRNPIIQPDKNKKLH